MADYHLPLLPGEKYHILSRAVGSEKLFRQDINYQFFLLRYQKYIRPIADTFCYCLLPNHFHFLLEIKKAKELMPYFERLKGKEYLPDMIPVLIMRQFSNLLNSYTKSFNKMYKRKGGLFIDYLRRVPIASDRQFGSTVFYIHKNPVHHGYCKKMEDWKWSSYNTMLSNQPTALLRNKVLNWFGGLKGFSEYHDQPIYIKGFEG
jgi:putative transposase